VLRHAPSLGQRRKGAIRYKCRRKTLLLPCRCAQAYAWRRASRCRTRKGKDHLRQSLVSRATRRLAARCQMSAKRVEENGMKSPLHTKLGGSDSWLPPMAIFNTLSWRFVDKIATGGKHGSDFFPPSLACSDSLMICAQSIPHTYSSQTLPPASTSSAAGLKPFWTGHTAELSASLWLPTKTDSAVSHLTSCETFLKDRAVHSWFSVRRTIPVLPTCLWCDSTQPQMNEGCCQGQAIN
jgi:hypothetical protein